MICIGFAFCSKPSSISESVNEKNATSAPEINAEQSNSTNKSTKLLTIEKSIAKFISKKHEGSGSKDYIFSIAT